ncbi:tetratricopeptide repeat protein [Vibrio rhizosphaerae]|uniref:tetratricopeptide repeat protein n=1 Tax=Vibrio rhizosphaerae TaxID=398736 RepID=UPI0005712D82|nr:tetratricopeptide repeat protein [Vibrio rhizosphaerae]
MNIIGFLMGLAGLSLILLVSWMMVLSLKQKRLEAERQARDSFDRRAREQAIAEDRKERQRKAEEGHIPTILYLAKEAEKRDLREALFWYEKAASLENITGMYGVVRICQRSRKDTVLEEKAKFWQMYIRGMEGDLHSLCETAKAYFAGLGISVDIDKGVRILEKVALSNFIPAQLILGDWYVSRENPVPKPEDACFWYAKAARLDSSEGMMKLGLSYLKGNGVGQDHRKGCYWLECAGEKGNAEAMYHAGKAWMDHGAYGNSVAYIWLFLSAHCGYEPAKGMRDDVGSRLGVDSIVLLQSFAKPLLKKIQAGTIGKHLIIRAFNKLYKRNVPIPRREYPEDDFSPADDSDVLVAEMEELLPGTDHETPSDPAQGDSEQDAGKQKKAKLDFTDKHMH